MAPESIAGLGAGRPPLRPSSPADIEAEAEEGLLLAEYATRMRLKNRIIVETLTSPDGIDVDEWTDEVRLALGRLRIEAEQSARRMASERDAAAEMDGVAKHEHDYRYRDAPILERRRRVYRALARRLLLWEGDSARVAELLDAARQDALEEMARAVQDAVRRSPTGSEDEAVLRERLSLIGAIDLPALAARRRGPEEEADRPAEPEAAPPPAPELAPEPAPPAAPPRRPLLQRAVARLRGGRRV